MLRYGLAGWAERVLFTSLPLGTLCVNLTGAFLIGILWAVTESMTVPPVVRTFLFIGLLGGFTTFSTFALENFHLLREKEFLLAGVNILASNLIGIFLVFFGYFLVKFILKCISG